MRLDVHGPRRRSFGLHAAEGSCRGHDTSLLGRRADRVVERTGSVYRLRPRLASWPLLHHARDDAALPERPLRGGSVVTAARSTGSVSEARPAFKFAGGKTQLLPELLKHV